MYQYCVLGSGRQGTAVAYDLAKHGQASSIILLDQSIEIANASVDRLSKLLNTTIIHAGVLDVNDHFSLVAILKDIDVLISAVPYLLNPKITLAAIESHTSMVDLGGHTENVRKQLAMDSQAKTAGITIVPDCGMGPGMNVTLAVLAMEQLDSVDHVRIWDGGLPKFPSPPWNYSLFFNINGLTNEYDGCANFIREGKLVEVPCFEGLENVSFNDPIGTLEAAVTSGGLSTMPWSYQDKLITLENKTLRYPGHWEQMIAFRQLGLFSEHSIPYLDDHIVPRDFYHHLLELQLMENDIRDVCLMRIQADGKKGGNTETVIVNAIEYFDETTEFTAMEKWTAWHASIVAIQIANNKIPTGAIAIENAISGTGFLKEATKRHFNIQIEMSHS